MVDIESIAVSSLEERLAYIERVKTFINRRDTQPIWDGTINVHSSKNIKKDNLVKAIPVQVKGDTKQSISKNTIYYSVDVADLKGFLTTDGAIYFVIGIDVENRKNKIYYACLLPIKIHHLLKNTQEQQKTKNIQLKAFPSKDGDILDIFLNFIRDSNKQSNVREIGVVSLTDLQSHQEVHHIEFGYTTTQKNLTIGNILGQEVCVYAVNAFGVSYPIQEAILTELKKDIPQKITCGGKLYYDKISVIQDINGAKILLGNSLSIEYIRKTTGEYNQIKVEFNAQGTVKERLRDINFFIAIVERQDVYADDKVIIKLPDDFDLKEDFEEIKKHRDYLEKIAQAMELAGIPDNRLSFEELDKNNSALANILFAAFVNKSAVLLTTEAKDDVSFGILNLYNLKLIILAKRVKDNSFMIENFFTANLNMSLSNLEDKKYPSSRYVFLKQEHFLQGDNINYKNLYEDVTSIPINIYHFNRTTLLLLEMIKAYDVNKDKELIDVAEKLSIWLVDRSFVNNRNVALINLLQIKQRKNSINESDKQQIINMLKSDIDKQYQAACYILLNMPNQAQGIIDSMDEEQRNIFTDYPIYDLLKNN